VEAEPRRVGEGREKSSPGGATETANPPSGQSLGADKTLGTPIAPLFQGESVKRHPAGDKHEKFQQLILIEKWLVAGIPHLTCKRCYCILFHLFM
jgi:hypothetical protein